MKQTLLVLLLAALLAANIPVAYATATDTESASEESESGTILVLGDEVTTFQPLTSEEKKTYTGIKLPESLLEIPEEAFLDWVKLQEITIPSNVKTIGKKAFEGCGNLRTIRNLSSQTVILPTRRAKMNSSSKLGIEWYVDGKKVTKVLPGKTAVARNKKFALKLDLNGGKIKGKKVTKYTYAKVTKLSKAEKKGYVFFGWRYLGADDYYTMDKLNNQSGAWTGTIHLEAVWRKFSVKKYKNTIRIKAKIDNDENLFVCLYSTNKNMKNAKIISRDDYFYAKYKKKGNYYYARLMKDKINKDISVKIHKKTVVYMIKNIKKGSTYYLDFHTNYDIGDIELDDYENVPIFCEQVWKRVRVKT